MITSSDHLIAQADRVPGHAARSRTSVRRLGAAAAAGAAALVALAGCASSSSNGGNAATSPATGGTAPAAASSSPASGGNTLAAGQALQLALRQTAKVNSLTATLSVQTSGTGVNLGGITGDMRLRLKPTLLLEANISLNIGGAPSQLTEILTSNAIYLRDSALSGVSSKPWIKISLAQLSSKLGANFSTLFQNLQNSNPLTQTRLFGYSKNVHQVGTAVINGISTTEYAGTYDPATALSALSPALRKTLGPMLRSMGASAAGFEVWIDGQHQILKAVTHETLNGQQVTTTYQVTSINQPISVTLPPASQIASLPKF